MEFWINLAEEEIRRQKKNQPIKNYIKNSHNDLIQLMIANVIKVDIDDEDETELTGVSQSASAALYKFAYLLGSIFIQPVVSFVSGNITSQDPRMRYASVISLGTCTECQDKQAFAGILIPSIQNLLQMYNDNSVRVRQAISWFFYKIAENYADIMTQSEESTQTFVQVVLKALKDKPNVSAQACQTLEQLAIFLRPNDPQQMTN